MDYSKTIIYKIVSNDLNINDVYVGHTTNFIKRKAHHKSRCNNINDKCYNLKVYKTIRENGNWDNWNMIEIEKYPCNDINEACARERYYYELLNAKLNIKYPGRNQQEYQKLYKQEYYEDNKDKIKDKVKKYREDNKDKIKERKSKVCICECGCEYTHDHKSRHLKSQKHQNLMIEMLN